MKITPEHYSTLKSIIGSFNREQVLAHKALKLGKDPEMRFRWDLFTFAMRSGTGNITINDFYRYANDSHIDTALKRIVRELGL
jgi:hypothetical protein